MPMAARTWSGRPEGLVRGDDSTSPGTHRPRERNPDKPTRTRQRRSRSKRTEPGGRRSRSKRTTPPTCSPVVQRLTHDEAGPRSADCGSRFRGRGAGD
jgi:hypothetical protein